MKRYQILDTESTREFAESLIGMIFRGFRTEDEKHIELRTGDGELLFADDEVQEVSTTTSEQNKLLKQLQELISKVYEEQQKDEIFKNELSNTSLYNYSLKECFEIVSELEK